MAKRNDFPASKGIRARIEAIISSHSQCANVLRNLKEFALPHLPEKTREIIADQINDALAAASVATDAISGD